MLAVVASFGDSTGSLNVLESPQSLSYIGSLKFARCEKSRFFHGSSLVIKTINAMLETKCFGDKFGMLATDLNVSVTYLYILDPSLPLASFNLQQLYFCYCLCSCTVNYDEQVDRYVLSRLHCVFLSLFKTGNRVGNDQSSRLGMLGWRSV